MILTKQHILLFFIFIICIGLITCLYIRTKNNELFTNEDFDNSVSGEIQIFTDTEISNVTSKNAINKQLQEMHTIFNKYASIDPSISINNNGVLCDNNTTCKLVTDDNSQGYFCLNNNVSTSCGNFFNDGYINKQSIIDLPTLLTNTRNKIITNIEQLDNTIATQSNDLNFNLNKLLSVFELENQQIFFIDYNINNLNDKSNLVNKTSEEFEKNESDINVNQVNFTNFIKKNNNYNTKIDFYYKIIIGLIITIIVVGIFNILITNML